MNKEILRLLDRYAENQYVDYGRFSALGLSEKETEMLIKTMDDFLEAMNAFNKLELKKEMSQWQLEMDEEQTFLEDASSAPDDLANVPHGTLQKYFVKQPIYASLINGINRNNAILLQQPLNGFNWNSSIIKFELKKKLKSNLFFEIENNRRQIIKKGILVIKNKSFNIELNYQKLLPGRYYLKLFCGTILSLFEFFIHKDLISN